MNFQQFGLYLEVFNDQDSSFVTDELTILLWMSLAGFFVLSPAIYFFRTPGAIVGVLTLAVLFLAATIFLSALGSAYGGTVSWAEIFLYSCQALAYFSFLAFGIHLICYFDMTQRVGVLLLATWFAVLVLIPGYLYGREFLPAAYRLINFIKMDVIVSHDAFNPIVLDELRFMSSRDNRETVYRNLGEVDESRVVQKYKDFEKLDLKQKFQRNRVSVSTKDGGYRYDDPVIPLHTDKFVASWYSPVEDKFYRDEFPFPMDRLEDHSYRHQTQKIIRTLRFHIFPHGHATLYDSRDFSLGNFFKIAVVPITDEMRSGLLNRFHEEYRFDGSRAELEDELLAISQRYELSKIIDQLEFFNWSIRINVDEAKRFTVVDCQNNVFRSGLKKPHRGALPQLIGFEFDDQRYQFYLERNHLNRFVKETLGDTTTRFRIRIDFDPADFTQSKMALVVDEQAYEFFGFEVFAGR